MLPSLSFEGQDVEFHNPPTRLEIKNAHPWLRCFAKVIDLTVFGFLGLVFALLMLLSYSPELYDSIMAQDSFATSFFAHVLTMFFWLIMEAQFVYHGINTPGRKLFGLEVKAIPGQNQHPLNRSLSILFKGIGAGLVVVALIAGIWSYTSFLKKGVFPWDKNSGYRVTARKVCPIRIYFGSAVAIGLLLMVVVSYLSSLM